MLDAVPLVDNASLRQAVAAFASSPDAETYRNVLRECLQGDLLMDATESDFEPSDNANVMPAGTILRFTSGVGPDGQPAFFAFTRQEEAQKLHPDKSAKTIGSGAVDILSMAVRDSAKWLYIDPHGPTCAISTKDAEYALRAPMNIAMKTALSIADKRASRKAAITALSAGGELLQVVRTLEDGTTQARTTTGVKGEPLTLSFTSELEIAARYDEAYTFVAKPVAEVVSEALTSPYAGLLVNPGGPWMAFTPKELRRVASAFRRTE